MFKSVEAKPNFIDLEHRILAFWEKNDILAKYLRRNDSSAKRFSFLDGPITANNPMAVHHAWGRTLKDLYQRFHNMLGEKQRFQNGFDNQGLWVEVEVEKKLGFKSKKDIESFGIAAFVEKCKEHTLEFARIQTEQSQRLGYFMDWGNDYYTLSDENNYAIWHFLKKVVRDGNLYKGRDSVPWCPRCGTAISQHEILSEEYQELTHDSIYFELPIVGRSGERFLVWTTTPWTIPANVALAVHPELEYWLVTGTTGLNFWVVGSLAEKIFGSEAEVVKKVLGKELLGLKYTGPFDALPAVQLAEGESPETFHSVVAAEELVNEEEGTGIVHIATGCGTEDFRLGEEAGLPILPAIDEAANYLEGYGDLSGKNAKNEPRLVLDNPALGVGVGDPAEDYIFEIKPYTHRYPVCWRCKTELVWRVVDEWYIAMDDTRHKGAKSYRERLKRAIKDVHWIPEFGYARELDWFNNMEDWLISKKRYWGLALPIWECSCGHFEVIGSKEELEERAVAGWEEFSEHSPHRPWIDAVKINCARCGESMSRITDVGSPWLDAGIVSYSTLKYFEDRDYWKEWFPADLVLECFPGQFKNWFYSLLAMSVVLEDRAPFQTLLGHELVRNERGEEMHKSKGNAIWFDDAAEKMGVDAMRWLYARQDPRHALHFGYGPAEEVRRRFFLILWNCYKFFVTYAELDDFDPAQDLKLKPGENKFTFASFPHTVLDVWILSKLNELVRNMTERIEGYEHARAAEQVERFVVDDLSTWYIRRIRGRVGPAAMDEEDKKTAHRTLYSVLLILSKLLAPFVPFLAEEIYRNLVANASERVQPPKKGAAFQVGESVHLTDWPAWHDYLIDEPVLRAMEAVREICEKGHAARREAQIKVRQPLGELKVKSAEPASPLGGLKVAEEFVSIIRDELNVKEIEFAAGEELVVELDTQLTPELRAEGGAREMVRSIQAARRQADCRLDERIIATFPDTEENKKAVESFGDYIRRETLAAELTPGKDFSVHGCAS